MLYRVAGEDEHVAPQDVVNIGALLRQHVDPRQISRGSGEILVDRRAVDDQDRIPAEHRQSGPQRLSFGFFGPGGVDDHELALAVLRRQRGLETEPAHFLLQAEGVAAHHRAKNPGAAAKLRRAQAALTGAARTLLLIGLFGRALDVADAFGLVGAGAAFGELPIDDPGEDVAADRKPEHGVVELDVADLLIVEIAHDELAHVGSPAGASTGAPRTAAGKGSPSGAARLAASLTRTKPPLLPGTAPLIISTPRSASAEITSRLWIVTRAAPRCPAIFLFLNVLPGDWRWPVEPWLRCETETP